MKNTLITFFIVMLVGCATVKKVTTVSTPEQPTPTMSTSTTKYVVIKGDCLWDISSKEEIYQDPFLWPLLFKINRDQIEDPDIIEINQELKIDRETTEVKISDAVNEAKNKPAYKKHKGVE